MCFDWPDLNVEMVMRSVSMFAISQVNGSSAFRESSRADCSISQHLRCITYSKKLCFLSKRSSMNLKKGTGNRPVSDVCSRR